VFKQQQQRAAGERTWKNQQNWRLCEKSLEVR